MQSHFLALPLRPLPRQDTASEAAAGQPGGPAPAPSLAHARGPTPAPAPAPVVRSELFEALTHREDLGWHCIVTRVAGRVPRLAPDRVAAALVLTLQDPALVLSLVMNLPGRLRGLAGAVIEGWTVAEGWARYTAARAEWAHTPTPPPPPRAIPPLPPPSSARIL